VGLTRGAVPEEVYERLIQVGRWVAQNGEALYG
jgi:alpha-L-fucosidase